MMKKHAYLIIAHNNFDVLEKLLKMLDFKYHDIYMHIDKKVKDFNFEYFKSICKESKVCFTEKRIDVKWGHQTQVLTEMLLFETAYKNGEYSYFHLLSGVDLPLKKAEDIYTMQAEHGKSFIQISPKTSIGDEARVSRYNLLIKNNKIKAALEILQRKLKINRTKNVTLKKGANWASLTNRAVCVLLKRKREIKKLTFLSNCADEIYKQTILYKYAKDDIYFDENGNTNFLRYVDWSEKKKNPKILTGEDFEKITASGCLFARKFDSVKSKGLINKIYDFVMNG